MKTKFLISAFLLLSSLLACGHSNTPEGVAEEFLFRYFIELNQRGALELSTGLATDKLKKEIELTQDIRVNIRVQPDLDLAQHKPFLDYELVNKQNRGENSVTFYYGVTIENKNGEDYKRELTLTTVILDGEWKVNNFDTFLK